MEKENKEFIETQRNYSESVDSIFKLYSNQLINYTELKDLLEKSRELYNVSFESNKETDVKRWREIDGPIHGYFIDSGTSTVEFIDNRAKTCFCVFATKKTAKSALAMAQISQIMANDERFGGVVTDEEWKNIKKEKFCIERFKNVFNSTATLSEYKLLAFHTEEQRDLFLKENEDLVKQYLMID